MPTQNVNLSVQQARFVRRNVKRGGFHSASEVVRAGLRLLEQQQRVDELKLHALRKLCKQSFDRLDQGEYVTVDPHQLDAFLAERVTGRGKHKAR